MFMPKLRFSHKTLTNLTFHTRYTGVRDKNSKTHFNVLPRQRVLGTHNPRIK